MGGGVRRLRAVARGNAGGALALANGYWGTRARARSPVADEVHYPGTYFAGVYDVPRGASTAWRPRTRRWSTRQLADPAFRLDGGDWFGLDSLDAADVLDFRQELDVRHGILSRGVTFRDALGRVTTVRSHRFVSQASPHLAALRLTILPVDWSGPITVRTGVDGGVANSNVPEPHAAQPPAPASGRAARDRARRAAARDGDHEVRHPDRDGRRRPCGTEARMPRRERRFLSDEDGSVVHEFTVDAASGEPLTIEKVVCASTSRDRAVLSAADSAAEGLAAAAPFDELLRATWRRGSALGGVLGRAPARGGPEALALTSTHSTCCRR